MALKLGEAIASAPDSDDAQLPKKQGTKAETKAPGKRRRFTASGLQFIQYQRAAGNDAGLHPGQQSPSACQPCVQHGRSSAES
jgi:hypothetical protein